MALLDFIPAASSFLTGLFGMGAQSSANNANMELAKYQFEKNKEMWHEQNRYNSPEQQMARLKAAGLNPNLVYGNGAVGNATGGAPTMERPTIQSLTDGGFIENAVQRGLFTQAQLDNLRQQTELTKYQQGVQQANISRIGQEIAESMQRVAKSKFELGLAKELRQNSVEVAKANLQKIKESTEGQRIMNDYNKARTDLIPLQGKLTEAQIESLATATAQAKWELQNEYAGRIPKGMDLKTWFMNQVLRGRNDLSSIFTGKNRISIDEIWDFLKGIF